MLSQNIIALFFILALASSFKINEDKDSHPQSMNGETCSYTQIKFESIDLISKNQYMNLTVFHLPNYSNSTKYQVNPEDRY